MNKLYLTWSEILDQLDLVDQPGNTVYGVPKGGMLACAFLKRARVTHKPEEANVILDDIKDSGWTQEFYTTKFPRIPFVVLVDKPNSCPGKWVVFPWEKDHPHQEDTIEQNIIRQLQFIGEDPEREGLKETPARIARAYGELFAGYSKNVEDLLTVFAADGHDQVVLLKDIEMYSMCEHHMLPFFGKAHVAYIPGEKIVGISKLARLVDMFSRRLQIQERIGDQVTHALMEYLKPVGAACIIEAQHLCMRMRGCNKQNSIMVTSSMKGVFLDKPAARAELLSLVK